MRKPSSKNVLHSIYTQEIFENIASALGISKPADKAEFKNELEQAAKYLLEARERNNAKFIDSKERKILRQLENHLRKSKKLYEKITQSPQSSTHRFYGGLYTKSSRYKEEQNWILNGAHDGIILRPNFIEGILDVLEKAARQATKDIPLRLRKHNKTEVIFFWLACFSVCWGKISKVKLSVGRYYKEQKLQKSKAVEVLLLIAAPLNKLLPSGEKITSSKLVEALELIVQNSHHEDAGDY